MRIDIYEIASAVNRGFNLLTPEQRAMVKLDTLDMADGLHCIIGQIFGGYAHGIEKLLNVHFNTMECDTIAEFYGFYVIGASPVLYEALTAEWKLRLKLERESNDLRFTRSGNQGKASMGSARGPLSV